jgi:hypothetical protein
MINSKAVRKGKTERPRNLRYNKDNLLAIMNRFASREPSGLNGKAREVSHIGLITDNVPGHSGRLDDLACANHSARSSDDTQMESSDLRIAKNSAGKSFELIWF